MKRNGMHVMYAGRTNHLIRSRSLKRHLVLRMTHVTEWFMSTMHSLNMSEYFNHAQSTIGQYQGSQPSPGLARPSNVFVHSFIACLTTSAHDKSSLPCKMRE